MKKLEYGQIYIGCDPAREGADETVIIIIGVHRYRGEVKLAKLIYAKAIAKSSLTHVAGLLTALYNEYKQYGKTKLIVDESGLGGGVVDMLKENKLPVVPITMTAKNKTEGYKRLKLIMEAGKLKFPRIEKLIFQLVNLQYEYSYGGNLKIHAPEGEHDDWCDALMLACYELYRRKRKVMIA